MRTVKVASSPAPGFRINHRAVASIIAVALASILIMFVINDSWMHWWSKSDMQAVHSEHPMWRYGIFGVMAALGYCLWAFTESINERVPQNLLSSIAAGVKRRWTPPKSKSGIERELRFLVEGDAWRSDVTESRLIQQGYLSDDPERVVRVRIDGNEAFLTIKGRKVGDSAPEFEYQIPLEDGRKLFDMCRDHSIIKTRHIVPAGNGFFWEVDEFHLMGSVLNPGLVIAEIELPVDANVECIAVPAWIGGDITTDWRYSNAQLANMTSQRWNGGDFQSETARAGVQVPNCGWPSRPEHAVGEDNI